MEAEEEREPSSAPKLPLLSISLKKPPEEHPGALTPALHTSASIPFLWEEEPGKPRPYRPDLITLSDHPHKRRASSKSLELPPRLQLLESKKTEVASPTTILDGPYVSNLPTIQDSSLKFKRERGQGSFVSSVASNLGKGQFWDMVLNKRGEMKERGLDLFSSLGRRNNIAKREALGKGNIVFSSSMDNVADFGGESRRREMIPRIKRSGSFSRLYEPRSHFFASMYEGLKQVLPRRSKQRKIKEGLTLRTSSSGLSNMKFPLDLSSQ